MSDPAGGIEYQEIEQTPRFHTALRLVGVLALSAVVGISVLLLLASREQPEEVDATASPSVDATDGVKELEEILAIVGLDGLAVELDGSVLRITGTVASADELRMARDAAAALADHAEVDTSGVQIGQLLLGASESSSSRQTDQPEPLLQRDLNRLLTLTPIMFDPGRSDLGELDKGILNVVAGMILSVPGATVTVIGHGDDGEAASQNVDLATGRSLAVRDHLVSQGVQPDLVTTKASTETAPSASTGAIALKVTLEAVSP